MDNSERAAREQVAYDHEQVFEQSQLWHSRFDHVFFSPDTRAHERRFEELIFEKARGGRVLDIGCGFGHSSMKLSAQNATYVLGVDVSTKAIERARIHAKDGELDFVTHDIHQPLAGKFDLILGRAILHHIDYRAVLPRLRAENLAPGGRMIFIEPLAGNLLARLYRLIVPEARTRDERPFTRGDLGWLCETFASTLRLEVANYLSFAAGILSSLIFAHPDNALLRAAHRLDVLLARAFPFLRYRFRSVLVVIDAPQDLR